MRYGLSLIFRYQLRTPLILEYPTFYLSIGLRNILYFSIHCLVFYDLILIFICKILLTLFII